MSVDAEGRKQVGGGWGKSRRLGRLCAPGGRYLWLALDHGLTHGQLDGLTDIPRLLSLARAPGLDAIVANRGMAVALPPDISAGLVLQAFGRPAMAMEDSAKVPTCRVEDAIRLGADAVSVQLDLGGPALSHAVHAVSQMISDAASYDIPVLIMVTPKQGGEMSSSVANALRVCAELGADLIKVGLPAEALNAHVDQLAALRTAVGNSPPVLLGGGTRGDDLLERLALAREVGAGLDEQAARAVVAARAALGARRSTTPGRGGISGRRPFSAHAGGRSAIGHKTGGLALRGKSRRSRMRIRLETSRNAALLPIWTEMVRRSKRREIRGLRENASLHL